MRTSLLSVSLALLVMPWPISAVAQGLPYAYLDFAVDPRGVYDEFFQLQDTNDQGQLVGYWYASGRSFFAERGLLTEISGPPGFDEQVTAHAINEAGVVVGQACATGNGCRAFRWTKDGGGVLLGVPPGTIEKEIYDEFGVSSTIQVPFEAATTAVDVNDVGQIVGEALADGARSTFLYDYTTDTWTLLTRTLDEQGARANAVNNEGWVVGTAPFCSRGTCGGSGTRGFLWRGTENGGVERFQPINPNDTFGDTIAYDINDSGVIAGYSRLEHPTQAQGRAVTWQAGNAVPTVLDHPGNAVSGVARRINNAGGIFGSIRTTTTYQFIWGPGGGDPKDSWPGCGLDYAVGYLDEAGQAMTGVARLNGRERLVRWGFPASGGACPPPALRATLQVRP